MNEQVRRLALPLTLLAMATQWLNVGLEKVFLLPHVPVLLAYRQAHPLGNDQALAAATRAMHASVSEFELMLHWQPLYGTLTALGLGCLVAAGLAWQQRISWLVLPLVPLGTAALAWLGGYRLFKYSVLQAASLLTSPAAMLAHFVLAGLLSMGGLRAASCPHGAPHATRSPLKAKSQ